MRRLSDDVKAEPLGRPTLAAPDHLSVSTTAPDHLSVSTTAPDHLSVSTTAADHLSISTTAPDHLSISTTTADHLSISTTTPDHLSVSTTAPRASAAAFSDLAGRLGDPAADRAAPTDPHLTVRTGPVACSVAGTLAGLGVLAQIASPLLNGAALRSATIGSVLLLAAAAIAHAGQRWGRRAAVVLLLVAAGIGLTAEVVGVHTGLPFGRYHYSDALGPKLAGVPMLVPLAWTMLAYPALLLGRRLSASPPQLLGRRSSASPPQLLGRRSSLGPTTPTTTLASLGLASPHRFGTRARETHPGTATSPTRPSAPSRRPSSLPAISRSRWRTALLGGTALAGWDLFLDPQMVARGYWHWAHPAPALPGVPTVPLSNYAGWLLISVLMVTALDRALDRARHTAPDRALFTAQDTAPDRALFTGQDTAPDAVSGTASDASSATASGTALETARGSAQDPLRAPSRPKTAAITGTEVVANTRPKPMSASSHPTRPPTLDQAPDAAPPVNPLPDAQTQLVPAAASARTQLVPAAVSARAELVPAAVLAWTWLGSIVGNLAFFGRPWVALWGGLAMGAVVLPYLLLIVRNVSGRLGSTPTGLKMAP